MIAETYKLTNLQTYKLTKRAHWSEWRPRRPWGMALSGDAMNESSGHRTFFGSIAFSSLNALSQSIKLPSRTLPRASQAAFFVLAVALSLGVAQVASGLPGDITTVAGGGGSLGDGGPATSAQLSFPRGIAFDGAGNTFIADTNLNRIRKVDTNGIITTVAGTGVAGFSGDGGSATSAQLKAPADIAFDGAGNLFIADFSNSRIRKLDTSGIITTVVGTGAFGFSGDSGPATSAKLNAPSGVAFDGAGNLFIADFANRRIRKVDTSGIITTFASGLGLIRGIAIDGSGNVFTAGEEAIRIWKVDTSGMVTTFAGTGVLGFSGDGGPATSAQLRVPQDVALDGAGNLFFSDASNNRIRKVDTNGIITTVAGTGVFGFSGDGGPATSAQLRAPAGVAFDGADNLFIGDMNNNRIRKVFETTAPIASTITPTTTGPTNATSVDFAVTFSEDVVNFDAAADVVITHTGTASTGVTITGGPQTYTVSVTGITGDGSFTLAASTASDIQDLAGNALISSVTSAAVFIDSTPPLPAAVPYALVGLALLLVLAGASVMLKRRVGHH